MRRVLIVVSAFRPAMVADMQRARMLAWELPKLGWQVEVLTPRADEVRQDVVELNADAFFPTKLSVHEVGSWTRQLFEWFGLGSRAHGWRTFLPMRRRGSQLLRSKRFDLVFFTTTTFSCFILGPYWLRTFGVPYVLDLHDPWVRSTPSDGQPSRSLKSRVMAGLSARMERAAVVSAAGLVAVSPRYVDLLRARYEDSRPAWLREKCHEVIPFGVLENDLAEAARKMDPTQRNADDRIGITYVGAGGPIMVRSFGLICRALATLREQGNPLVNRVRVELFGTIYAWKPGDQKHLEQMAKAAGVGDLVSEEPARVSYRRSLELLLAGDCALILGVDDSGYMPSKLFSYALSGKPLLASLHRASPAYEHLRRNPELGHALWFDRDGEMPLAEATTIVGVFLDEAAKRRTFDRRCVLEPFLAPAMARRHAELFEAVLRYESRNKS